VRIEDAKRPWLTFTLIALGALVFMVAVQHWVGGANLPYALGYAGLVALIGSGIAAFRLRRRLRQRDAGTDN
jgi:membrane protein implicated in regulation of membrane protease activity